MWDAETNWRKGGQDFHPGFETAHFLDGFATPDKKFRFKPDWAAFGPRGNEMPALPDHFAVIDKATAEKPFRLVAAPARTFLNSTFTETPTSLKREGRPTALMHPEDCTALGIAEGDRVGSATSAARPSSLPGPGRASSAAWWSSRASGRTATSRPASASTP